MEDSLRRLLERAKDNLIMAGEKESPHKAKYARPYSATVDDIEILLADTPPPASVGEPAKEFEKALDNYARTVLTNDEWDNDYQGQWLGGKVQYLGAHSRFFTGIRSNPPATPVGELPDVSKFGKLRVNKSGHPDNGRIQIGSEKDFVAEMYSNDEEYPGEDSISWEESLSLATELVKRYNAYPELLREHERMVKHDQQLQEQNRVLREALSKVMKCIKGTSDLIKLGDSIYDIRYDIQSALNSPTK